MTWLTTQVQKRPDAPAFYFQEESWTFLEVQREVNYWVTTYQTLLPATEKRVALFSKNSKELYFSILALWELGREILFLNTHLTLPELTYQLTDAQVTTVIAAEKLGKIITEIPNIRVVNMVKATKKVQTTFTRPDVKLKAVASIMYTSGTTGKPKGVLQRFENHLASALGTQENMEITSEDCWLCPVPLFHISGLSIIVRQLVLGCSVRLYQHFDEEQVTADLMENRGTVISVVSLMLQKLLEVYPATGYGSIFKGMLLGGGPIAPDKLALCQTYGVPVIQSYGMTETCSQVVALKFTQAAQKIGSAGKPLKNMHLKIIDEPGQVCAAQQVGEILLKGPNVVAGYLNHRQPEKWMPDGWFRTGDMGYLDDEGYLYLVSRLSELIISGGENIYPTEIEHTLQQMSGVEAVAVVGESDEKWGAVPVAYIIGDTQMTLAEVQAYCGKFLAKYKLPQRIYFCHTLPQTASGKIAKHRLMTAEREAFLIR
ncbi:o-succinylbenzoate--CoA ligase [Enterococcus faecalis]